MFDPDRLLPPIIPPPSYPPIVPCALILQSYPLIVAPISHRLGPINHFSNDLNVIFLFSYLLFNENAKSCAISWKPRDVSYNQNRLKLLI